LPDSAAGMLGLSSIVWSQMREGGNLCDASSEKTLEYCWYGSGMFGSSGVFFCVNDYSANVVLVSLERPQFVNLLG
jgi:hypothetical protein